MPAPKLVIMHSYFISIESLPGDDDDDDGLRLFFKEHFLAHFHSVVSLKSQMVEYESTISRVTTRAKMATISTRSSGAAEKKEGERNVKNKTSFNGNIGTTRTFAFKAISLEPRAIHDFIFITSLTIASKRKSPTFSASHTIIFM